MSDSEHKVLAGILPDLTARMEKAQIRLIDKFNFENQAFRELWELLDVYYDDHMAIMPEWYLKDRALQSGMDPAKVLSLVELYKFLSSVKVNEHEFDAALQILKDDELTRKTAEALVTAREILQGEYYDDRSDKILRGQDHARAYLSESLQHMEAAGVEAAPEGDIRDDMEKLWAAYIGKEANPHQAAGIKYGIHELDECTGGVRPGELVLVAGFTGEGKSHLVASLAWNAMRNGKNVVMFTTETTREEMEVRVLARHSRLPKFKCPGGIDSHEILSGTLSQEHKRIFRETIEDFKALDAGKLIMVQMPANGSVDYVHAKANQYNRSTQVDLIVIDSINLLRASRRYESKREMLEDILQDFKRFASSFDGGRGVAVVSPWQMSRTAWKEAVEAGGTYTLASLADTSEAEKCLPLNAKVLAGDGFVRMGDISPGDKILGADSELQTVLDVHDNGVLPILEVVTQDGRVIECTPGHIWTIMYEGSVYNVEASQLEPYLNEAILPSLKTAPLLSTEGTKGLELLDPKYLAAMLREKSPVAGSLSVTTDDVEHLNQAIPTLPQYALAYSKEPEELTFIYSATSLAEDPHLLTYQEAGLLSGDVTKFRIPEAYQTAHPAIREALVLALAGNPSGRLARLTDRISILSKLPYDHPGFGEDLKELVWSLGLSLQGDLPRIVEVRKTTRLEETRCITVSNPDGLFVTDHFVITHNSASQIITIFKGDGIGEPGRVNIQALKHRSGSEMSKVSYPIDYRNSYIGSSNEVSQNGAKQPQAKASMVQDISSMLGL